MASVVSALELDYGLVITRDHLAAIRRRLFERFATELLAVDGVEDAIRAIDVPFCVASSSQLERIRYSLQVTGLLEYFDPRLYSSSMVTNGKPAPDLFLHAATAMDVAPAHCLVIEDSGAGIMAARRAGMRVFAFVGATHAGPANLRAEAEALAPDAIFSRMRDLPALIRARTRKAKDG